MDNATKNKQYSSYGAKGQGGITINNKLSKGQNISMVEVKV